MKLPKLPKVNLDLPKPLKMIQDAINKDHSSTTTKTSVAKPTTSGRGQQIDEQKTQREQIKEELLAEAKGYLDNFEKYDISIDKPDRKYQARKFIDPDGVAGYVIKYHCDGFNRTHYEKGKENPVDLTIALNHLTLSAERLADDEGHEVFLWHDKIPIFFINNRRWVTVYYHEDNMDTTGHSWMFDSSKGTGDLVKANKSKIGKDVVASFKLNYFAATQYDGGMLLEQVIIIDPAGSIPKFFWNLLSTRVAESGLHVADYLMKGILPPDMHEMLHK